MRTGASGVCSMGGLTGECNSAELRFWYGDEQTFKDNLKYCIANNIYAICNLDFHKWDSHYPFDINRLEAMMTIMAEYGATKSNSRITVENEPMKYWSKEEYCDMVNQSHAFIAGRYDMGAGGEEFGLAMARGLFPYLFETAEFEYFDIHIQATMIDPATWRVNFGTVNHYLSLARNWCNQYGKKLSCTEANWSKIKTAEGHADLMQERELARQYGCEDFNIVFIDGKMSKYEWLAYTVNGRQNSIHWNDLRQKMLIEKEENMVEYLRPIVQQEFYNAMGWDKPYHENTPSLPIVGRKDANKALTWGDYDAVTETILKGIIKGLKDNGALPISFPEPMDIKYNPDGSWQNNWEEIAESNPDQ